jgi:hypothetical protein
MVEGIENTHEVKTHESSAALLEVYDVTYLTEVRGGDVGVYAILKEIYEGSYKIAGVDERKRIVPG